MGEQPELSALAKRFLAVIQDKDVTAYELGKTEGLSSQIIYNIKKGLNDPSLKVINSLLKKFPDINPFWLNNGEGTMYKNENTTFIFHEHKQNILDVYSLDEIVSFIIENEKEIVKNSAIFKEYLKLKENQAVLNYLQSSIKNLES